MERWRWWLLVLTPGTIVSAAWHLRGHARDASEHEPQPNHVEIVSAAPDALVGRHVARRVSSESSNSAPAVEFVAGCELRAETLRRQLPLECAVIVRAPFVLAGDMSTPELDRWHRETICPAMAAMQASYFDTPPHEPITVLLFAHETSYNHFAKQLFGDVGLSVYGYYRPQLRTLVLNIGTGGGTLVHELTHALVAFDFAEIPEWFNEGLASLHEACRIRDPAAGLEGLVNWRLRSLQAAVRNDTVPPLEELLHGATFRGRQVGLNYAQARYLCLFLERRGLLSTFYRELRTNAASDPTGHATLLALFPGYDWQQLDREFRTWVLELR